VIEQEDVLAAHEREVLATEAYLKLKDKTQDAQTGCLGLDPEGLPITDARTVQPADVARKEAAERREAVKEL
jgi:hypothetical protein